MGKKDPWTGKTFQLSDPEKELLAARVAHSADIWAQAADLMERAKAIEEQAKAMRQQALVRTLELACDRIGLKEKRSVHWKLVESMPVAFEVLPVEPEKKPENVTPMPEPKKA